MKAITYRVTPASWLACKLLGRFWAGVYVSALSGLRLDQLPVPSLPGDHWVLCRTVMGGICGTDLGMVFLRQHPATIMQRFVSWPVGLGHENVAQIVGLGSSVTGISQGQRVVVDPSLGCLARQIDPPCKPCRDGLVSLCQNFTEGQLPPGLGIGYNNRTGGSWGQYFVAHMSQVHPVPDQLSNAQAVLTDPLACALHGVLRDRPDGNQRILIVGGGAIGLAVLASLRALGCDQQITLIARYDFQAQHAEQFKADHVIRLGKLSNKRQLYQHVANISGARPGRGRFGMQYLAGGFERVYDCSGNLSGFSDALRFAESRGTVVVMGTPQLGLVDITSSWLGELKVIGATGRGLEDHPFNSGQKIHTYRLVQELMLAGKLPVDQMLTHQFPLGDYRQAIAATRVRAKSKLIKAAFLVS